MVVFHGLEGSIHSHYAKGALCPPAAARERGGADALSGCSGEPNRLLQAYHSGAIEDAQAVIAELGRRFPGRPLVAIGYSLGQHAGQSAGAGLPGTIEGGGGSVGPAATGKLCRSGQSGLLTGLSELPAAHHANQPAKQDPAPERGTGALAAGPDHPHRHTEGVRRAGDGTAPWFRKAPITTTRPAPA